MAQQTIGDKLVYAAGKGYIDDVAALLNQKADVNAKDQLGNTALIAASGAGHVEVVKLLLSKGVNVNAQNTQGNTALHQAVWRNHLDAVKVLVTSGAKQDVRNSEGKLAADWASTPELKALLGVKSNSNAPEEDLSKVEDLEFGDSDEE